jgi:hypothetical protein
MASNIKIKRSEVSGNPAVLGAGELAYSSLLDNGSNGGDRLYIGSGVETDGNAVNHLVIGGKFFTDMLTAATATNTVNTLVKRNSSGAAYLDIVGDVTATDVTVNSLTDMRVVFSDTNGKLVDNSGFTFNAFGQVSVPQLIVNSYSQFNSNVKITQLTEGRITFTGVDNTLTDSAGLTFVAGVLTSTSGFSGALTGNAATATKWATARNLSLTGDATATLSAVDGSAAVSAALTLATVNSNVGSFGSTTAIPVITVNAKGLITAVTTQSISTDLNIAGNTGTDTVGLASDTLTFEGGTGVATTVTNNKVSFAIGQSVGTTDSVTFNNLTVNGSFNSDDITATNISVDGNATITGNLTVQGTTTTVNSTAVAITDINLTLAKDATTAAQAEGAGLTIAGPTVPATFTYTSTNDRWNLNKNLVVSNVYGNLIGNADTSTILATTRGIATTGDATWSVSFNGSADVSSALTLATVNANVGSFGTTTTIPLVTVNAKGLVTAITTSAIPTATTGILGLASFVTDNFTVTAGAVSISKVDGGTY